MEDALASLDVWTCGCHLAVQIYRATTSCRDLGSKDQITRAAVSIPSNIAEGFERNSKKDFANYLRWQEAPAPNSGASLAQDGRQD